MAGFADLFTVPNLIGAAGVASSIFGANAAKDAGEANAAAINRTNDQKLALLKSGRTDAFGNKIDVAGPDGSLTTTLTPESQRLADAALSNENNRASITGDALDDFRGFTARGGRPDFSLQDAQGVVSRDNQLIQNSVINRAVNDASALDKRTFGNSSNTGSSLGRFIDEAIQKNLIGGDREAFLLKTQQDNDFIKNSLGIAQNTGAGLPSVGFPSSASAGTVANFANSIPQPGTIPTDNVTSAAFTGIADLGRETQAQRNREEARASQERILQAILANRQLGNQTSNPKK